MVPKVLLLLHGVVTAHVVDIRRERHLGVDNHLPVVGIRDNHVGLHPGSFLVLVVIAIDILQELLHEIFPPLGQSRPFQYIFKNHLSPVALHLGVPLEGIGEVIGLGAQPIVQLPQVLHLLPQRKALFCFGKVHLFHLLSERVDVLAERLQDAVHVIPVEAGEPLGFLFEDFGGDLFELQVEALPQLLHLFFLYLQLLFGNRELNGQRRVVAGCCLVDAFRDRARPRPERGNDPRDDTHCQATGNKV